MLRRYLGSTQEQHFRLQILSFFDSYFQMIRLMSSFVTHIECPTTPTSKLVGLGSSRFTTPLLKGIEFSFLFLPGTKMFRVLPGVPSDMLCAQYR